MDEQQMVDPLVDILESLDKTRAQTAELARKASGPVQKLARMVGGSVLPLLGKSVLELAGRADTAELRLQRLEAHVRLIDDEDVLAGLPMDPIDLIQGIVLCCELAKRSPEAEQTEVSEHIVAIEKAVLDWRDYLGEDYSVDDTTEEPEEEAEATEEKEAAE